MAEQEQTAVLEAEQTPAEVVAQTEQAAQTPEAVADSVGTEAEATAFDLTTFEGIEAFRRENPHLDAYFKKVNDDGFNAGRQKRDKELRLERGTEEVSRAAMDALAQKYGIEFDDSDKRDLPLWVRANRDAERVSAATKIISKGLHSFGLDDEARAAYIEQIEALADEPDRLESIAEQVMAAGSGRMAESRIGNLTLGEVPKDSRLHASLQAFIEAREAHFKQELEKELAAREAERPAVDNRPRLPKGSVPAGGAERYKTMTPAELAKLSPSEWDDYKRVLAGVS
jgi:hypothetical protein